MDYRSRIIVALDLPDRVSVLKLVDQLKEEVSIVKLGSILFCQEGPSLIKELKEKGFDVFLDLKFYDIPNTVALAISSCMPLGVKMMTLHASGGSEMFQKAKQTVLEYVTKSSGDRPLLLGVTALTSFDEKTLREEMGIQEALEDWVKRLAHTVMKGGGDGIVASGQELKILRESIGKDSTIVCPGIRPEKDNRDDQRRTMTPLEAFQAGANYIVIGRPIYLAEEPRLAFQTILNDVNEGMQSI